MTQSDPEDVSKELRSENTQPAAFQTPSSGGQKEAAKVAIKAEASDSRDGAGGAAGLAEYIAAKEYLEAAALGTSKVDLEHSVKSRVYRTDEYSDALMTYLAHHLGTTKGKTVTLALAFMARQLTNRTVTAQNDLAVLIHGLQYAVHDLAIEARELRELAVSVADQESFAMDPTPTSKVEKPSSPTATTNTAPK